MSGFASEPWVEACFKSESDAVRSSLCSQIVVVGVDSSCTCSELTSADSGLELGLELTPGGTAVGTAAAAVRMGTDVFKFAVDVVGIVVL